MIHTILIPDIRISSDCIIDAIYVNNTDITLHTKREYLEFFARLIIKEELKYNKKLQEMDLGKISEAINSGDYEIRELYLRILEENTKYAGRLIRAMIYHSDINYIIIEYNTNNKFNLTDEIL